MWFTPYKIRKKKPDIFTKNISILSTVQCLTPYKSTSETTHYGGLPKTAQTNRKIMAFCAITSEYYIIVIVQFGVQ